MINIRGSSTEMLTWSNNLPSDEFLSLGPDPDDKGKLLIQHRKFSFLDRCVDRILSIFGYGSFQKVCAIWPKIINQENIDSSTKTDMMVVLNEKIANYNSKWFRPAWVRIPAFQKSKGKIEKSSIVSAQETLESAQALIALFSRCILPNKCAVEGSQLQQARAICAWMHKNQQALNTVTYLNLSTIFLKTLPPEIFLFHNLTKLDLSGNLLTAINMTGLPQLQYLNLSFNQLTALDVTGLTLLKNLDLSGNLLTAINMTGLPQLQYLNLSSNRLTALDVTGLPQLQHLNLSNNQLTEINVTELPQLQHLVLFETQLTVLHESMLKLPHFCQVFAENNIFTPAAYVQALLQRIPELRSPPKYQ
jgi:hypothetical protein